MDRLLAWLPDSRGERLRWGVAAALVALAFLLPPIAGLREMADPDSSARFTLFLGTSAVVLALYAVSYNLMLGYTGLVSFAHAAYFGVGAYAVAIFATKTQAPLLAGLLLAPLAGGVFGLATGWVALRAVRLYFSLLTLAISQLMFVIAFQWYDVTGGDNGIAGLVAPEWLSDWTVMYYAVAAIVAVCLAIAYVIVRSPFGAALATIRENRERARSVGINVKAYELAVFTVAAVFGGMAGGLYILYQGHIEPTALYWSANAQPVVITLLGGTGSFLGPAVGAFVYQALDNTVRQRFTYQFDTVLGAIVLAVVLFAPGGFASLPELFRRLRSRIRRDADREPGVEESAGEAIRLIDVGKAMTTEAIHADRLERGAPLLVIESLSKSFGGLRAVQDVTLTVHSGDRHAIIGPNGAGKSTLFNLITGRLRPNAGRVTFEGRDITGRPPHAIARAGIGRAFQITMIFPKLTVLQNLQYAMLAHRGMTRRPWGWADRYFRDEAMELLEAVGLGGYAGLPAGQLSHGDQRAIELAISLALGSKMVLLDEPTAGMAPYETQKAMELVRRIGSERGLTLLFCEHDMEVVFGTARTVTVMHQGRVLTEGTPEEVRRDPEVQKVYLGEPVEVMAGA